MSDPTEVRFLGSGVNWMPLLGQLSLWLAGYHSVLPEGSTSSVTASEPGRTCFDGPLDVVAGKYHMAITTPTIVGSLAVNGQSPFEKPLPLRAIASFPHDDRMLFAVKKDTGIKNFADIRDRQYPLRISTPVKATRHPGVWCAERVLQHYGFNFDDIVRWGGEILNDRPRMLSGKPELSTSSANAIFDEAIMTLRWKRLSEENDLHFLSIDNDVMEKMEAEGWQRGRLARNTLRGMNEDLTCVDFSGWLLYCSEDLPDELAYFTVMAIDAQKESIERISNRPGSGLTGRIDMSRIGRDLPLRLHPGAQRYYEEKGYL